MGRSGSDRCAALDASSLSAMQAHELRLDEAGRKRRRRKVDPLILSPHVDRLSLQESYEAHVGGAKRNARASKLCLYAFVQFPTDLEITPETERSMLEEAARFVDRHHGGRAVFRARLDRDEAGRHGVDVLFAPRYSKKTAKGTADWVSLTRFGKANAVARFGRYTEGKYKGRPMDSAYYQGRALQDLWFEHLRGEIELDWVVRGVRKVGRDPDRLEPQKYGLRQDQARVDRERLAALEAAARVEAERVAAEAARREIDRERAAFEVGADAKVVELTGVEAALGSQADDLREQQEGLDEAIREVTLGQLDVTGEVERRTQAERRRFETQRTQMRAVLRAEVEAEMRAERAALAQEAAAQRKARVALEDERTALRRAQDGLQTAREEVHCLQDELAGELHRIRGEARRVAEAIVRTVAGGITGHVRSRGPDDFDAPAKDRGLLDRLGLVPVVAQIVERVATFWEAARDQLDAARREKVREAAETTRSNPSRGMEP